LRAGLEGAKSAYFADESYTTAEFQGIVSQLIAKADHVYHKAGVNETFDKGVNAILSSASRTLHNPEDITHEMRMVKDKEELRLMQEAARISADAHCAAARICRPELMEYNLQATIEHVFMNNGAMAPAYTSIVATGGNGWVLHYVQNDAQMKAGELVLIDAACEYKGYAADITRTFPVSGKFSAAQSEIYQLVLDAQLAAIDSAKPGTTLAEIHQVASDMLRKGLVNLGLLDKNMKTAKGERRMIEAMKNGKIEKMPTLATYYPHGTGHFLGLDVHDVSNDGKRSAPAKLRALEPGMVFTVEPGLYFASDDVNVPKKYRGIAVRIEDDVVITKNGCRVLTHTVPKEIAEVEKLMGESRLKS
jgi:Xaa-Pro aminopeptidase